jgi:outer membrane protein assembly factor BamD
MHSRFLVFAGSAAIACGSGEYDFSGYVTPQAVYDSSMAAYRVGDCDFAEAGFKQVALSYPARDERQADARFYTAECLFNRRQLLEAARVFRRITDEFPRHRLAPDALLRTGDAYAEMWKTPDLDPTYGETAVATYQELMQRFRGTPAADRARLRIAQMESWMAGKEFKSGTYYIRMRAYDSAIIYFRGVVANYPQSDFASLSVVKLIEIYERLDYQEEKNEMCGYLSRYYPGAMAEGETSEMCAATEGP